MAFAHSGRDSSDHSVVLNGTTSLNHSIIHSSLPPFAHMQRVLVAKPRHQPKVALNVVVICGKLLVIVWRACNCGVLGGNLQLNGKEIMRKEKIIKRRRL